MDLFTLSFSVAIVVSLTMLAHQLRLYSRTAQAVRIMRRDETGSLGRAATVIPPQS